MGILGKILLVVNLLAAGGFVYLAVQDRQGRQNINAAGLRHLLVLRGLPVGDQPGDPQEMPSDPDAEVPFRVPMAGGVPTETVSPKLLQSYFAQAGGAPAGESLATANPVPNQLAEVRRVYTVVKASLEKQDGPAAKTALAARWVLLQAESYEERLAIQAEAAANRGDLLEKRLVDKFERVLNPPTAGRDEGARRERVAHLLAHLDRDAAWQKRVVLVVGVREYVRVIAAQVIRFREMAAAVDARTASDQARFVEEYAQLRGLAIERTQMVQERAELRNRLAEQARRDQDFVNQRLSQIKDLEAKLEKVRGEVNDLLAKQTVVERQLYEVQREAALTLEDIYRLNKELAKREQERYGKGGQE